MIICSTQLQSLQPTNLGNHCARHQKKGLKVSAVVCLPRLMAALTPNAGVVLPDMLNPNESVDQRSSSKGESA